MLTFNLALINESDLKTEFRRFIYSIRKISLICPFDSQSFCNLDFSDETLLYSTFSLQTFSVFCILEHANVQLNLR